MLSLIAHLFAAGLLFRTGFDPGPSPSLITAWINPLLDPATFVNWTDQRPCNAAALPYSGHVFGTPRPIELELTRFGNVSGPLTFDAPTAPGKSSYFDSGFQRDIVLTGHFDQCEPFVLCPMYLLWLTRFPYRPFYICCSSGRCVLRWSIAQCVVLPYITVRARKRLVLAKIVLQEALMLSLLLLLSGDIELNPGPAFTNLEHLSVHVVGDSMVKQLRTKTRQFNGTFKDCDVHAYPGKRVADITRAVDGFAENSTVDIVILMVGTNDVAVPTCVRATPSSPALFKQHYNTLLQTVRRKYPNAAIFMHDLFPRYSSRRWQYRETNTQLLNFTKEFNTVLRGFCARGIANVFIAENFDNTVNFMGRYLSTDGLHLSEQGYNIMCLTLKQVISSYFSISPPSHVSYCSCSTICICHCHAINKTLAHHTVRDFTSALRFTWLGKRAVCYFGDVPYGYGSGNRTVYHDARSISESPLLSSIADEISRALPGVPFNSVLVNYYKDGSSYMPFHSDDEKCIAPNSTIISVSYGESRPFHFQRTGRHFHSKGSDNSVTLESDDAEKVTASS